MSACARLLLLSLAACHEYTVSLTQVSATPLPVTLSPTVEMPVGLVVTVLPSGERDGEALDGDTLISLASSDESVLSVSPVAESGGHWALVGAKIGQAFLEAVVDGREAVPLEVIVTAQ